jgi:hypothetical protein
MALPINPFAKAGNAASSALETAMKEISSITNPATGTDKDPLASLTNDLSAGIGSGLNGFASGLKSVGDAAGSSVGGEQSSVIGAAAGSLGLGGVIQSGVSGAIASGQSALGSIGSALTGGLDSIAAGATKLFKSAAGQVDDILSKKRGKNVPKGAEQFNPAGRAIELTPASSNDWRVRLNADWSIFPDSALFDRLFETGGVVWPYLPTVAISTSANYTQIEPTHNNYPFQSYKNSQVNEISISGEFTCETEADAEYWIAATLFFKTATKMFFGQGANVGNPPIVCTLSGYGASIFDNIPVVIKTFSVDLPPDVNYINYNGANKLGMPETNTWVPIMSTISVTVMPIYNRERLRQFSLQNYAVGNPSGGVGFI